MVEGGGRWWRVVEVVEGGVVEWKGGGKRPRENGSSIWMLTGYAAAEIFPLIAASTALPNLRDHDELPPGTEQSTSFDWPGKSKTRAKEMRIASADGSTSEPLAQSCVGRITEQPSLALGIAEMQHTRGGRRALSACNQAYKRSVEVNRGRGPPDHTLR